MLSRIAVACLIAALLLPLPAAHAVQAGLASDFEADPVDWFGGARNPNPPVRMESGGPAGDGDGFLQLTSNGSNLAGGRLTAFSFAAPFTGDYTAAGVAAIAMDLINLGDSELVLRLQLSDATGGIAVTSAAFSLPAQGDWTATVFDVSASALTSVGPVGDVDSVLAAVAQVRIMHSFPETATDNRATPRVIAQMGMDNVVLIVPEPRTALLMLGGLVLLASWPLQKLRPRNR